MDTIKSLVRHFLTFLAGAGTWLATRGLIPADSADAVNAAGADAVEPLTILLVMLAIAVARTLMAMLPWLGAVANGTNGKAPVIGGLLAPVALAGIVGTALPACSPQAAENFQRISQAVPVQACYVDENGNRVCYSTKDGVSVEVDRRSSK